ncbi:MAG: hypothetical protein NVS4B1_15230 [Ktedonobacteraceae bacterium]
MRHTRLFLYSTAILIALLATTVSLSIQGTAAYAHTGQRATFNATCSGEGCDNVDPLQSGCAVGAYTVTFVATSTAEIQLRYSPNCGTNWGRVVSLVDNSDIYLVLVERIDGVSYGTKGLTGPVAWSRMVYAPQTKARACVSINGTNPVCTKYI